VCNLLYCTLFIYLQLLFVLLIQFITSCSNVSRRLGALYSTKKILDSRFLDGMHSALLLKKQMTAPYIPEPAIDIKSVKSETTHYAREKKANKYPPDDKWEAFDALIKAME
jgi:hypothetical protein